MYAAIRSGRTVVFKFKQESNERVKLPVRLGEHGLNSTYSIAISPSGQKLYEGGVGGGGSPHGRIMVHTAPWEDKAGSELYTHDDNVCLQYADDRWWVAA